MRLRRAVDADNLPGAAASLLHDGLFTRPDPPESRKLCLRVFALQLRMFRHAEDGVSQRLPVFTWADNFDITPHFAFVAQQQRDIIAAVTQVKPEGLRIHEGRLPLL